MGGAVATTAGVVVHNIAVNASNTNNNGKLIIEYMTLITGLLRTAALLRYEHRNSSLATVVYSRSNKSSPCQNITIAPYVRLINIYIDLGVCEVRNVCV